MSLPDVHINRKNGQLKRTVSTTDNVFAMLLSGAAVTNKINLGEPKLITGTDDLDTYGITEINNALAFAEITAFYNIMGNGAKLYIMLFSNTTLLATVLDYNTGVVRDLLDFGEESKSGLFVNKTLPAGYTISLVDGLDADVWNGTTKLQALCEAYGTDNNPLFAVIPGFGFTAANAGSLRDMTTMEDNQVSIVLGSDDISGKAAIATLCGQLAKFPVQQNPGNVENGSVLDNAWFMDGTQANAKTIKNLLGTIHDRRYIFFRKFNNKSGYYFNDDPTACAKTDDFSSISWNRVMNKAQILAYNSLVDKINSDVEPDTETGGISPALAADWEGDVETEIRNGMIRTGNISAVKCTIDTAQSNLLTDQILATINIVRKGQAKSFEVSIGYVTSI